MVPINSQTPIEGNRTSSGADLNIKGHVIQFGAGTVSFRLCQARLLDSEIEADAFRVDEDEPGEVQRFECKLAMLFAIPHPGADLRTILDSYIFVHRDACLLSRRSVLVWRKRKLPELLSEAEMNLSTSVSHWKLRIPTPAPEYKGP